VFILTAEYLHTSLLIEARVLRYLFALKPQFKYAMITHKMSEGLSNQSYLLVLDNEMFVLRINAEARELLGVDSVFEPILLTQVQACYPEIIHQDEYCLVTRFVSSDSDYKNWYELGKIVCGFHQLRLSSFDKKERPSIDLSLTAQLVRYQEQSRGQFRQFETHYTWLNELEHQQTCICHMDLREDNFRWRKQGCVILDWEYARSTHPIMDLSCLKMTISDIEFEQFLQGYQALKKAEWLNEKDLHQGIDLLNDLTDCWLLLQ
jgi:thiamine kinase-like enzyme